MKLDKMHIEKKQEVWWVHSPMIIWVVIFYKAQEWHATAAIQMLSCLALELRLKDIVHLMDF